MSTSTKAHLVTLNAALSSAKRHERILPGRAMRTRVVAIQAAIIAAITNR